MGAEEIGLRVVEATREWAWDSPHRAEELSDRKGFEVAPPLGSVRGFVRALSALLPLMLGVGEVDPALLDKVRSEMPIDTHRPPFGSSVQVVVGCLETQTTLPNCKHRCHRE